MAENAMDFREPVHEASEHCWCKPIQDPEFPEIWVHNSRDKRELYENLPPSKLN